MTRLLLSALLALLALTAQAQPRYQLEKVVEISRHGVRPPTAGNRTEIEAATSAPGRAGAAPTGNSPHTVMQRS